MKTCERIFGRPVVVFQAHVKTTSSIWKQNKNETAASLTQVGIYALIAVHEYDAERGRHEASVSLESHVVALAYVIDMNRNGGICANAMLLHQRDQFTL